MLGMALPRKVYRENQPHYQPFMEAFYIALVGEMNIPVPKIYAVESFLNQTAIIMDQVKGIYDIAIEDPSRIEETLDTVVEMQIGYAQGADRRFCSKTCLVQILP